MATTSDRADSSVKSTNKKKKEEDDEGIKSQSFLNDTIQGKKSNKKVNGSLRLGKTDALSSIQSIFENKKSDRTSTISDKFSDSNMIKKKNGETTHHKEESGSRPVSSASIKNNHIKKEETIKASSTRNNKDSKADDKSKTKELPSQFPADNNTFSIEKDDAQHLTDFQLEKAKYFFNVNLDIENKEYVTWEDVEFYLLFHATAAGKEGSDGDDLEARLSRAARAFWEHVHDQVPLPDGKRDTLTLNQFLDAWAGLIDYVVRTNQLPSIIQELVRFGFELYSTDNGQEQSATIQPAAFDQLFQKMNIGRPYAIMAYKYLTENGTKPLDADKIDSIVKAVITSSDDEHDSHFLLPGFFKTIANYRNHEKDNKNKISSPLPDENLSQISDKSTPSSTASRTPTPPSPLQHNNESSVLFQAEQHNGSASPVLQEQQQYQQPSESPPPAPFHLQPQNGSPSPALSDPKSDHSSPNLISSTPEARIPPSPTPSLSSTPTPQNLHASPKPPKAAILQEDDNIRRLLRFYHIDDGDLFEVADGPDQRLVLVHPERPLPPYIQHDRHLLQRLQPDPINIFVASPPTNEKIFREAIETKSDGRTSRSETQKRPTPPNTEDISSASTLRQTYSDLSEEQRRKAAVAEAQRRKTADESSSASNVSSTKPDDKRIRKDINHEEEEKIVAAVLKQLAPMVEKRVSEELRRMETDETDQDEDEGFIPFPFMLAGGLPFFTAPSPQTTRQRQGTPQQNGMHSEQQTNGHRGPDFGGLPGGAAFIPPPLLMAMMSDLTRGVPGGEMPSFSSNMSTPSRGPNSVEGFMMFVDDNQMMGGPSGYSSRSGPRF